MQVCYATDCDDAKVRETVCPLEPVAMFHNPPPSVAVQFLNPDVGNGLFTVDGVRVFDGDSVTDVGSRLLKLCRSTMLGGKGQPARVCVVCGFTIALFG